MNNLKILRWKKNLSQEQLSIKSGVKRSTISSIENGEVSNPGVYTAIKLAKALEVNVEDIFTLV